MAAAMMTSVLVNASGRSSRPVSPVNANTGRKLSAVISSEMRIAGAIAAGRADQRSPPVALGRAAAERLQATVARLQRHHVGVDRHTERDADAAQAHDRGRDAEQVHSSERQQQHQRQRQQPAPARCAPCSRNIRITSTTTADLLGQRAQQRVLDSIGQVQSAVDRDDLDVAREVLLRLFQRALDRLDDRPRICVALGDDDSPADLRVTAQVGDADRHVRGERRVGDVAEQPLRVVAEEQRLGLDLPRIGIAVDVRLHGFRRRH